MIQITDECLCQKQLNKLSDNEMVAVVKEGEIDYSESAHVDSQYEYLQKHKFEGITLEEVRSRRASKR